MLVTVHTSLYYADEYRAEQAVLPDSKGNSQDGGKEEKIYEENETVEAENWRGGSGVGVGDAAVVRR